MKRLLLFASIVIRLQISAQQAHDYKVVATYHIACPGGWDYIAAHEGKLYVSHGTQVNVLDEATGDSVGIIPNTAGVHGIAFDVAGRGYTSNGRSNNVTVFDVKNGTILTQIETGENPDAIMFEPYSKTIITCNGRSKSLSIIDPVAQKTITTIEVGGKPETAVSDAKGFLYVNIEDKNEIVVVDLKTKAVLHHWPLDGADGPTGLAFDKGTRRLFAGCEKQLVVMNADNGKVISKLPIGDGCDGVAFNEKTKQIFTSNGSDGNMTVIKEEGSDRYKILGSYPTKRGGRTIAIDPKDGTVFIPAADYEVGQTVNSRPKMIPGSFQVLVIK